MLERALVLCAALAASGLAVGQEPAAARQQTVRVAVLDFGSFMMAEGGASVNLGKALAAMLVGELDARGGIQVVERSELRDVLSRDGAGAQGRLTEDEALEIGRLLGAEYVLLGEVTSIVDQLRLDIRALDVRTSEVVAVLKKSDRTSELPTVVADLVDDFCSELDLTPPSARPAAPSLPVRATIEFSRALDSEDLGDFERAIAHYETTLQIHRGHREAMRALERLRGT